MSSSSDLAPNHAGNRRDGICGAERKRKSAMVMQRGAEEKRMSSQVKRKGAEVKRKGAVVMRKAAEGKCKGAVVMQRGAEEKRMSSQVKRKGAEVKRKVAVITRKEAEIKRKDTVVMRKDAKGRRKGKVAVRRGVDVKRMSSEVRRKGAEVKRKGAVVMRKRAKRKVARVWLPNETWVDTFKFLSRRDLLRHVQPTCHRFHALAELHVHNVHVIRHSDRFVSRLSRNLSGTNKHCAELAACDASLAEHFRLGQDLDLCVKQQYGKINPTTAKRRHCAQMSILRHSLDLLRGCRLDFGHIGTFGGWGTDLNQCLAYLELLRPVQPFNINLWHEPDELLREPTILSCARLTFYQGDKNILSADSVFNWLHHLPNEDDKKEQGHETRILKVEPRIMPSLCAEIIERCKKLLQQSESPLDRRPFLLIFRPDTYKQMPFRLDHPPTGEVLHLQTFRRNDTPEGTYYHLRRCPIGDLATADQFYRDNFKDKFYCFRIPVKDGFEARTLKLTHDF